MVKETAVHTENEWSGNMSGRDLSRPQACRDTGKLPTTELLQFPSFTNKQAKYSCSLCLHPNGQLSVSIIRMLQMMVVLVVVMVVLVVLVMLLLLLLLLVVVECGGGGGGGEPNFFVLPTWTEEQELSRISETF
ncbi:hypothetical protein STEG23_015216 [Scotinomys teguina]